MAVHPRTSNEAERIVDDAEETVEADTGQDLDKVDDTIEIHQRKTIGFLDIARTVLTSYPKRTVLGLSLFIGQAFLYNAITFGYATILTTFYKTPASSTGYYYV